MNEQRTMDNDLLRALRDALMYAEATGAKQHPYWCCLPANLVYEISRLERPPRPIDSTVDLPADPWHDIRVDDPPELAFFWIVPKTADETYCDSSGKPIMSNSKPHFELTSNRGWSSLNKATHWSQLPKWLVEGPKP